MLMLSPQWAVSFSFFLSSKLALKQEIKEEVRNI
jgi:hypothetical protein